MKPSIYIFFIILCIGCQSSEPRKPISNRSGTFFKESAERNKKLYDHEEKLIKQIIKNSSTQDFVTSTYGFWYAYKKALKKDTIQPESGDILNFDLSISDLNKNLIYPEQNRVYAMDKEELFSGLREGLKLMKPSEEITFIFPSHLAFGYYGDDTKIGTNVPLICEVKLNSILKNND